ncbi:hypothetical protein NC651_005308 [Populus alba x Populus x berolinensis]|nr:hypothetical protein NC651_005308 [Populus alba x Populus x berolinensis]
MIDQEVAVAPTSVKSREHAVALPSIEIRGMYANGLGQGIVLVNDQSPTLASISFAISAIAGSILLIR